MTIRTHVFAALLAVFLTVPSALQAQDLAAAKKLLDAKNFEEALEAYGNLLDKDGVDQAEVRHGLAVASYWTGDAESATFHAARGQALKPDHEGLIEILALGLLASGDLKRESGQDPTALYEQAVTEFTRLTKKGNKDPEVWAKRALALYWLGRMDEAGDSYARASELAPKDPLHAHFAAFCYQRAQKLAEAVKMGEKALKLAPKESRATYAFALAQYQQEKTDNVAAAGHYTEALASGQLNDNDKGTAAKNLYVCYAGNQDWTGLSERLAEWRKKQPGEGLALWWSGYVSLLDGKAKESAEHWKRLESHQRYAAEAAAYYGICQQQLGDEKAAIEAFIRAAKVPYDWTEDKDPILKLHGIAGTYFSQGNFERACEIAEDHALPNAKGLRRVLLLSDLGLFHRDWGTNLEARGKKDEAKKHYKKALDVYETSVKEMVKVEGIGNTQKAQIQNDYALMFQYHFDDNETAVENYKIALGYDRTLSDSCLNYGRILMRLGKNEEALMIAKQGQPRADLNALIAQLERKVNGN